MKCRGTVVKIEEDEAIIEFESEEACSKCCSCDMTKRGRSIRVDADKARGLSSGDPVEVEIASTSMMQIYILLYGVPLAVFVGIMLAVYGISRSPVLSFAGAFTATLLTYCLIAVYMKKAKGALPDITVTKIQGNQ